MEPAAVGARIPAQESVQRARLAGGALQLGTDMCQRSVERPGSLADGLAQSSRSLPGGCRQRDAESRVAARQEGQQARRRGGLARPGTAGHQREGPPEAQLRRAPLGGLWVGKELREIVSCLWGRRAGGRAADGNILMASARSLVATRVSA